MKTVSRHRRSPRACRKARASLSTTPGSGGVVTIRTERERTQRSAAVTGVQHYNGTGRARRRTRRNGFRRKRRACVTSVGRRSEEKRRINPLKSRPTSAPAAVRNRANRGTVYILSYCCIIVAISGVCIYRLQPSGHLHRTMRVVKSIPFAPSHAVWCEIFCRLFSSLFLFFSLTRSVSVRSLCPYIPVHPFVDPPSFHLPPKLSSFSHSLYLCRFLRRAHVRASEMLFQFPVNDGGGPQRTLSSSSKDDSQQTSLYK